MFGNTHESKVGSRESDILQKHRTYQSQGTFQIVDRKSVRYCSTITWKLLGFLLH